MVPAIIVIIALGIAVGSIIKTKKNHNAIEKVAAEVIQAETGVDIDKVLPPDK